jgi:hypothetical protein
MSPTCYSNEYIKIYLKYYKYVISNKKFQEQNRYLIAELPNIPDEYLWDSCVCNSCMNLRKEPASKYRMFYDFRELKYFPGY